MTRQTAISHAGGRGLALAAALLAVVFWASSFAVAKRLLTLDVPPLTIIWLRMAIASLLLLPVLMHLWPKARRRPGDLWWLLLLVLFEPVFYFLFEIAALQYTSSAQAGIIVAVFPLLAALGGAVFFREPLGARLIIGLALSIIGAIGLTLAAAPDEAAPDPLLGNTLEFLAMLCAVGYLLVVKHLAGRWPVWLLTAVQMTGGALFLLPGAWPLLEMEVRARLLHGEAIMLVAWLGVVVTVLAYGFYNFSISRLTAAQAGVIVNLLPVLAALIGWAWLGERLSPWQLPAAALVVAGVMLAQWRRRDRVSRH